LAILLGFIWLVLLVFELVWGINKMLEYVSIGIWGIFIIDFVIKFSLAPEKEIEEVKSEIIALRKIIENQKKD